MPLWFLLSLFCVRMLYATICNILNIRFLAGGGCQPYGF
jgi:hypothetical protein